MSGNTVRFRTALGNRSRDRGPAREAAAVTRQLPATRLARQLALAYFIECEIEAGRIKSYAEVAGRLRISRARVSQIADMVLLPLTVQEGILSGEVRASVGGATATYGSGQEDYPGRRAARSRGEACG